MRILLTNDDGITAPGIQLLAKELRKKYEVLVVAPAQEMSASGHAITIRMPLWVKEEYVGKTFLGYSVVGTPADCVKLGLDVLSPKRVDLVISGLNRGPNLGTDMLYSGTVSGALEGALQGVPSMAVSMSGWGDPHYETGVHVVKFLIENFPWKGIPEFRALNVNVPPIEVEELKGYRLTKQSKRRYRDYFEARRDPFGNTYYWMLGEVVEDDDDPESDYLAVKEGYVSITPITVFMTDHKLLEELRRRFIFGDKDHR